MRFGSAMTSGAGVGLSNERLWPVVGGAAGYLSGQEDAVAEKVESGAPVHLSRDSLGDRDCGIGRTAGAQMVTAGVDEGRAVGGVAVGQTATRRPASVMIVA
ncbi:hypothetical protein GCM10012280_71700 [Wenjunlia tyrosinilytica]|uniref:Uncharacterized protein n=1 Tax=Wenjunlia tyrosinilytica TaxID=1544741 RepID=A0A918A0D8_9ACTN|nr:hypothetical protein GCM10012280_71700 [Wenjunlia tyrosinilytica]